MNNSITPLEFLITVDGWWVNEWQAKRIEFLCEQIKVYQRRVRTLGRLLRGGGRAPQVLVSDGEGQFKSDVTVSWCDTFGITPRVGHLGQHGGIAILERFFRTLKEGCVLWTLVPLLHESMRREIAAFTSWYNSDRPHTSLDVCTPERDLPPSRRRV